MSCNLSFIFNHPVICVVVFNYLCNRWLSPLKLWYRISLMAGCARYNIICDKVGERHAAGRWFSPHTPVSFTNKTDHHDITEIVLKVVLTTINQTHQLFSQNQIRILLYLFFIIPFRDTLTYDKILFEVMSGKLSFIFKGIMSLILVIFLIIFTRSTLKTLIYTYYRVITK